MGIQQEGRKRSLLAEGVGHGTGRAGRPVSRLVSAQACAVEALGGEGSGHGEAQVDKKELRRKPSTSLAITVSRGPQHRKGPPPPQSVRRSQTLRQRAGQ